MTKKMQRLYARLAAALCSPDFADAPAYADICRQLRMPPSVMDELLLSELGMTGCELAAALRETADVAASRQEPTPPHCHQL